MKDKITYSSQDIEDLLLNKSFEELLTSEKEFALTQVENETEYKELRQTLLSVKQMAAEQESVYVPNKIKEDLMQMMEAKKKPIGWFGSIAAFLFPTNTSLFKKPGLQLATLGLLLLFVINIGFDFVNMPNKEMAINSNTKEELKEYKKEDMLSEEPIEIEQKELVNENTKINSELKSPELPQENFDIEKKGVSNFDRADAKEIAVAPAVEEIAIMDDNSVEEDQMMNPVIETEGAFEKITEMDEEVTVRKDVRIEPAKINANTTTLGDVNEVVSLNSVVVTNKKSKSTAMQLKSQSLSDNAEVIDLLFIAL